MSISVFAFYSVCAMIILNRYADAQFGAMGYYPYAYGWGGMYGGGGRPGCGGYSMPCYYQPYPIYGGGGFGGGGGGFGGGAGGNYGGGGGDYGGGYPNYGGGYPFYGNSMSSSSASAMSGPGFATSSASTGGFFG